MEIPAEVKIRATIKRGSIYYFKEENFSSSEEPHYFVVLSKNPQTAVVVLLVNATTKIAKRKRARKKMPSTTLVEACSVDCDALTEPSLFDCNSAYEKSIASLVKKLDNGELTICNSTISKKLLNKLHQGVADSPIVEKKTKRLMYL